MSDRIASFCLLMCSLFATLVHADESAPLLLKPPLPFGLIYPKMTYLPQLTVPIRYMFQHAGRLACLQFDVGVDGHVTNVILLKSTGDQIFDAAAISQTENATYEPAILNGIPVAVRMLGQKYFVTTEPLPGGCSWDMYKGGDAHTPASHQSAGSSDSN